MPEQALFGVKIIDLSQGVAGPYCTKLLADYGAEVIKVEPLDGGDPTRRLGPFSGDVPHPEKSGFFLHLNTNKLGITLDLKTATGQKILKELVKDTDILVESFRPGVMASWGLSYEELSQINPKLVMTSISNFGQTGPYRDYLGSELTLYAMGGKMNRDGIGSREPVVLPGNQNHYQAGNCAAMSTMFAYYAGQYGDAGAQHVDVAIYETLMASFNTRMPCLVAYAYTGERPVRPERPGGYGYPYGVYACQDGYVIITGGTALWPRSAALVGRPELANDPRYAGVAQFDPQAKEEFETTIWLPWIMERTKQQFIEEAQAHELLCGVINEVDEVVANPQFAARDYFVEIEHPVAGSFKFPSAPFKTSDDWWRIRRPAPTLGQHNEEVYCGRLGYPKEDLVRLRERGVI